MSTAVAEVPEPDPILTFDQVMDAFTKATVSDVIQLRETTVSGLRRLLEDAVERGQYIYRVVNDDSASYTAQILTTVGIVQITQDVQGRVSVATAATPLGKGTFDFGQKIIEHQAKLKEAEDGRRLDTGEQFGRFYL